MRSIVLAPRTAQDIAAICRPKYFLVYRVIGDDRSEIGRVLHDAMELEGNLPERYRHSEEADA